MQAKGPVAEDDTSLWGCLKRIEDARTGKPLSRAKLSSEMAGMILGALDTTSMTSAITLCALAGLQALVVYLNSVKPGLTWTLWTPPA